MWRTLESKLELKHNPKENAMYSTEHHDLHHEFPEFKEKIHELKVSNPHFERMFEEYHKVDKEIRRILQEIEKASDVYLENLKKTRLHLKDEMYLMLQAS